MTKRERTILIAVGASLGVLVLDRVILTPLSDRQIALAKQIDDDRKLLDSDRKLISSKPRLDQHWNENLARGLFSDPGSAQQQVVSALNDWVTETGIRQEINQPSANPQPVSRAGSKGSAERDKFMKLTFKFVGSGSMQQISRFIWRIQTAQIPLRITDMSVSTNKESTDDLKVSLDLATIFLNPDKLPGGAQSASAAPLSSTTRPAGASTSRPGVAAMTPTTRPPDAATLALQEQLRARRVAAMASGGDANATPPTTAPATRPETRQ
jgi:hypothetical protein